MDENPQGKRPAEAHGLGWLLERRDGFSELVGDVENYAVFMMSPSGEILSWNRGAELLKGYRADEITGRNFAVFYSEQEQAAKIPAEELEVAAATGSFSTDGWRYRKDGSRFWASVTISAIRHADGPTVGFLKITRDLTEHEAAAEALRQSEERLRLLIESVSEYAIFMLDADGFVRSWNSGARRIKGYEAEEIIGHHFSKFYPTDALERALPSTLLKQARAEGSAEHEGWRIRKDGSRFWGSVLITAIRDDSGTHCGYVKITRDLTEKRTTEQVQAASQRKDAFLATLAHELRNPLAPMSPAVDILLKAPHDTGRVIQIGGMLRRQVAQMARLIEDLVDLSRVTTGKIRLKLETVPLSSVVETSVETVVPLMDQRGQAFSIALPPEYIEIRADPHRLSQVISNLLNNSTKYTPPGGSIELKIELASPSEIKITVSDTGAGIEADAITHIFDLFNQGSHDGEEGLGIGLTLVRTLVDLHGGSIAARSQGTGLGSLFEVLLPVVASAQPLNSPAAHEPLALPPAHGCRVLVADDFKSSADMLALFLQQEGMTTAVAYDGRSAVEVAHSFRPDIACLDLGMPGMDGFEVARQLRKEFPELLIIAVSGWGAEEDMAKSSAAGFDAHLVKPVKPDQLRVLIHNRLPHC